MPTRWAWLCVTGVAAGCGGTLAQPAYVPQSASAFIAVPEQPPPGLVEAVPPRPNTSAVWIDGEWAWSRHRWMWKPGEWVVPPPNATYSRWVTTRMTDGAIYFAPGTWRDAQGQPIAAPPPLAVATVNAVGVVDADGQQRRTTVKRP
jgi:hypothetical protein